MHRNEINRREFLKKAAAGGFAAHSMILAANLPLPAATMRTAPGYIRPNIPNVPYPAHRGTWYADQVPDTLDLAEMAKMLVNGLTGPNDPLADYEQYFGPNLASNPPLMGHDWSDQCQMRSMKALPLMRHVSGSDQNSQIDQIWLDLILKSIGPDGLYYVPTKGRPWSHRGVESIPDGIYRPDGSTVAPDDPSVTQYMYSFHPGYAISTMMIHYLRDGNPIWKKQIEDMIDGIARLAIHRDDYAFVPAAEYEPNAKVPKTANMPVGQLSVNSSTWLLDGLGKYYRLTGYPPVKELGGKLVKYLRHHGQYFSENGCFNLADNFIENHFHSHSVSLVVMLDYAAAVNDRELISYVRNNYECFKTKGYTLTGFFPESTIPDYPSCETCEIADMIALSLELTRLRVGDYWDDADRWLRNQFAENQLTPEKVQKLTGLGKRLGNPERRADGYFNTDDRVLERNMGAFAGWASANEFLDLEMSKSRGGIMHCCTGNAAQTVYYLWKAMLQQDRDQLRVNLLLNRASEAADVYSYVPYEGRVDLKIKKAAGAVLVRVPEWVNPSTDKVACTLNGQMRDIRWEGRYANAGAAKPGDKISVRFPIAERTLVNQKIGNRSYTVVVRGNSVASLDPVGRECPLYARDYGKGVSQRTVNRFLAGEDIAW
jgi:hypothetical protein